MKRTILQKRMSHDDVNFVSSADKEEDKTVTARHPRFVVALQTPIHMRVRSIHHLLYQPFLTPFPLLLSSPQYQRRRGGIQSGTSIPPCISSFQVPHPSLYSLPLHPSVNRGVFVKKQLITTYSADTVCVHMGALSLAHPQQYSRVSSHIQT